MTEEPSVPLGLTELPDNLMLLWDSLKPVAKKKFRPPFLPEILLGATIS